MLVDQRLAVWPTRPKQADRMVWERPKDIPNNAVVVEMLASSFGFVSDLFRLRDLPNVPSTMDQSLVLAPFDAARDQIISTAAFKTWKGRKVPGSSLFSCTGPRRSPMSMK